MGVVFGNAHSAQPYESFGGVFGRLDLEINVFLLVIKVHSYVRDENRCFDA